MFIYYYNCYDYHFFDEHILTKKGYNPKKYKLEKIIFKEHNNDTPITKIKENNKKESNDIEKLKQNNYYKLNQTPSYTTTEQEVTHK